jgi:DNA-binding SARP family transcriptional activator/type II secretory pathway predicted ATPase ExeA
MTALKLFLLGPPRVELDGAPVDIERRKASALLIYLAVSGQPHGRDFLATLFYPDSDQRRARTYLRRDLAVLNTSLNSDWLIADRETAELKPGFWLDVAHFRRPLTACQSHDHPPDELCADCLPLLTEAVALYTDDFLAGFTLRDSAEFDDWQFFQAESLRQELATALECLVRGLSAQSEYDPAIPHARRWVGLDPLHGPAQRALIQLYDQAEQPSAALRQYEEYVALLEDELGLPPEEEATTLYEAIKAKRMLGRYLRVEEEKRKAPPRPTPKLATGITSPGLEAVQTGISPDQEKAPALTPSTPASYVFGREAELAQLNSWLDQALGGTRQLVFVTGESGLGKTTLVETFLAETRHKAKPWIGHGQCIEHRGTGEAYMPVLEAFGRLCREPGGQELVALLARLAPTWLVQMPWLVSPEDFEVLQHRVLATTRERMLREMVGAIEALTAERPLILVLEDLHWSDYSTLDLLSWLAQRQDPARLLLIGTYRPADVRMQDHPLRTVVQEMRLRGQCQELDLPFLAESAVEQYLASRFEGAALPAEMSHLHRGRARQLATAHRTAAQATRPRGSENTGSSQCGRGGVLRRGGGCWR